MKNLEQKDLENLAWRILGFQVLVIFGILAVAFYFK